MSRRVMFYHYILHEDKNSLLYKFYKSQCRNPVKGDWCLTVAEDLETLKIDLSEQKIEKFSEYSFKKLVNASIKKEAFKYLDNIKSTHTKVLHIPHKNLEIQDYLKSADNSPDLARFAFLCRSRMLEVGANFKQGQKFPICPVCKIDTEYDSQYHLMVCTRLNDNVVTSHTIPEYDDLFKTELEKKMVNVLKENFQTRK